MKSPVLDTSDTVVPREKVRIYFIIVGLPQCFLFCFCFLIRRAVAPPGAGCMLAELSSGHGYGWKEARVMDRTCVCIENVRQAILPGDIIWLVLSTLGCGESGNKRLWAWT